jgi:hypothetical protein
MVAQYSELMKLKHAKMIAKEGRCFIVEMGGYDNKKFLLYRECSPRNVLVGKRSSVDGILSLAKKATNFEELKKVTKKA